MTMTKKACFKLRTIVMVLLLLLSIVPTAWCDNEAGGSDMPWGDDPSTSINDIRLDSVPKHTLIYYDLQGRRVDAPLSGTIYIVNGKKVIKK